jgi:hypothetical protein
MCTLSLVWRNIPLKKILKVKKMIKLKKIFPSLVRATCVWEKYPLCNDKQLLGGIRILLRVLLSAKPTKSRQNDQMLDLGTV